MIMNATENKKVAQFYLGYIYLPGLKQKKTFQEKVVRSMGTAFSRYKFKYISKALEVKNKFDIFFLIFYEHIEEIIFNVIVTVVYLFFEYFVCLNYIHFNQHKCSNINKSLNNTTYGDFSGIGIPEIFMNIISCNDFQGRRQFIDIFIFH